jgi:hypothetical protein
MNDRERTYYDVGSEAGLGVNDRTGMNHFMLLDVRTLPAIDPLAMASLVTAEANSLLVEFFKFIK